MNIITNWVNKKKRMKTDLEIVRNLAKDDRGLYRFDFFKLYDLVADMVENGSITLENITLNELVDTIAITVTNQEN